MKNNRVVIDTNVFISALIGNSGFPYQIFKELIATGLFELCISEQLLEEYIGFRERAESLLASLEKIAIMIHPSRMISILEDDPDNRLLEIAVEAEAFAIVTGNFRDFDFQSFENIRIFSPAAFYEAAISEQG